MHLPSLLRFALGFVITAIVATVFLPVAVVMLPWRVGRVRLCNLFGKIVGRAVVAVVGATPRVSHPERLLGSPPAIYVANHTSSLDGFLCVWLCPYGGCGVFKKEIVKIPFYGWLAWLSGHLLVDRGNRERAVEALSETAAFVKDKGLSIWIMPEGTRSKDGALQPFKKGFVHLAIATGLPVVPVVIRGAFDAWPHGPIRFHAGDVKVDVLEPVSTVGWTEASADEHARVVRDAFEKRLAAA